MSAACDVLLLLVLYVLNKFFCLVQHLFALCSLFFCCSSGTGGCVALPSVAPPRLAGVTLAASLISLLPGDPDPCVESNWPCRRPSYWYCIASPRASSEFLSFAVTCWCCRINTELLLLPPGTFCIFLPFSFTFPRSLVVIFFP